MSLAIFMLPFKVAANVVLRLMWGERQESHVIDLTLHAIQLLSCMLLTSLLICQNTVITLNILCLGLKQWRFFIVILCSSGMLYFHFCSDEC